MKHVLQPTLVISLCLPILVSVLFSLVCVLYRFLIYTVEAASTTDTNGDGNLDKEEVLKALETLNIGERCGLGPFWAVVSCCYRSRTTSDLTLRSSTPNGKHPDARKLFTESIDNFGYVRRAIVTRSARSILLTLSFLT